MDQITCLQPKELVTVSFLKNISAFFHDSISFQRFESNTGKKDVSFKFSPRSLSGQDF